MLVMGDPVEAAAATRAVYRTKGTCYLRLGRGGEPLIHAGEIDFQVGKAIRLAEGTDVAILTTGGILDVARNARERLAVSDLSVGLYSVHTLKPIDRDLVVELAGRVGLIVTLEEHTVIGGLGGAVAEIVARLPNPKARLEIVGLDDCFSSIVGDQEYLRSVYGLTADAVVAKVEARLTARRR